MINPGVLYRVTGRYMDGQKIIGYHLVGEDGSQSKENKERTIWLISNGYISNMRIQTTADGEIIIRGKGVNLNKLPVYDPNKDKYRNDNISQTVANTKVNDKTHNNTDYNRMGQYKIIKRIMYKSTCLGYELQDYSGATTRKKRDEVMRLAMEKLISNAIVQKYTKPGSSVPQLILRGVDVEIKKLPLLIVNEQGKIVDPSVDTKEFTVRSAYMKHNGIVHDKIRNKEIPFKAGDFILYGANGLIEIKSRIVVEKEYKKDTERDRAVCDDYLSNCSYYLIEVFGNKPVQLRPEIVKNWIILKPNK